MPTPSFFRPTSGFTVGEIASLTGAEPRGDACLTHRIVNVAPIDRAGPTDLTFADSSRYVDELTKTRAGVCLLSEQLESQAPSGLIVLRAREPYRAFVAVLRKLFPDSLHPSSIFDATGIAPGASVHPDARLESGVFVDPGAVIGPRAEIGTGTVIAATAVVGPGVRIGRNCSIGSGSLVLHSLVGDDVIIHPGCRIGQDGFGYIMGAKGHEKIPQIGRVIIQNHVEIGAGTMIDRGGIRDTVIGEGTKIDNLVQIGHNCTIGRHCVIVAQSGLSGSVTLGDFVVLGARVGIVQHISVGEGAQLAASSTVLKDVPPRARWGGAPNAKPVAKWLREVVALERLAKRATKSE